MQTPRRADLGAHLDGLVQRVRSRSPLTPRLAIVLGSGLGSVADSIDEPVEVPFADLDWPAASAPGHAGRLLLGHLEGVPVACLQGRLHLYEGHEPALVVEPALLMRRLGATELLLTNAAGGINASYRAGTFMVIGDHLNLTARTPLIGPNDDSMGERFPDMVDAWSPRLRRLLRQAGADEGVALEEGVYAQLTGPNYETPAEVRMLRALGADAVGMSTVLEAIAARWAGTEVCGVSLISNPGAGVTGQPLSHQEVLDAAREAGPTLARVLGRFVQQLAAAPAESEAETAAT
jgi:purine-nucleoside phosphorylase